MSTVYYVYAPPPPNVALLVIKQENIGYSIESISQNVSGLRLEDLEIKLHLITRLRGAGCSFALIALVYILGRLNSPMTLDPGVIRCMDCWKSWLIVSSFSILAMTSSRCFRSVEI